MKETVLTEFGVDWEIGGSLSYWSPTSLRYATGKKTPPVMVTTGVGLNYFLKLAAVDESLNMFVEFNALSQQTVSVDFGKSQEDGGEMSLGT